MYKFLFLLGFLFFTIHLLSQDKILKTYAGKISFESIAPLETIRASTKKLSGIINLSTNGFSFKINMNTFDGFNNPLQKEHFFENYMETEHFAESFFSGKIIEPIKENGVQKLRAKGMLTIHGISNEVLIDVEINFDGKKLSFNSNFNVLLEDYNINVPKIVSQKISPIIKISVSGLLSDK